MPERRAKLLSDGGVDDRYRGSKVKILYLNNAPFIGGAQITLRHIIRLLDRDRFEPHVAIPESASALVPFFKSVNVPVILVRMERLTQQGSRALLHLARAVKDLVEVVVSRKIDILHSNAMRGGMLGTLVGRITGRKFVWTLNDAGTIWAVRQMTRWPDRVTCVSQAVYDAYRDVPRSHFEVIYNGVTAEELSPEVASARRVALRRELRISEDAVVVGAVSRLVPYKGVDVLVGAMKTVIAEIPNAVMVHFGGPVPGHERHASDLRRLVERCGLSDRTFFMGFRENVQYYYPLFDVFAHTPIEEAIVGTKQRFCEAFGMNVAEAMAHRLPVVASASGGLREVVEDGVTGYLVQTKDPDEVGSRLVALLQDSGKRRAMGEAAYRRYSSLFRQEREVRDFERLYLELMGRTESCAARPLVAMR